MKSRKTFLSTIKRAVTRIVVAVMVLQNFAFTAQAANSATPQGFFAKPMIAGGGYHTLALKSDGTVWAWGANWLGQLGDGTNTNRNTPVQVSGLTDIIAVDAGFEDSIALRGDGTVWTWGYDAYGTLGNGSPGTSSNVPVQVHGPGDVGFLTDIIAVAQGFQQSYALRSDGTVWAWGYNNFSGLLGDGTTTNRFFPVQVHGLGDVGFLSDISSISGGSVNGYALKSDGTVYGWGENSQGAVGNGASPTDQYYPDVVTGLSGVRAIAGDTAGSGNQAFALMDDGTLQAWGANYSGQLGDGSYTNRATPVTVTGVSNVAEVAAGAEHTMVHLADGTIWAWGANYYGELGDGTMTDSLTPVQVDDTNLGTSVRQIAAADYHSAALRNDGTVWTWGYNNEGELGNGTNTDSDVPVQVSGLNLYVNPDAVIAVDAAVDTGIALKLNGTVWTWGAGSDGELGNGANADSNFPVQVHGVGDVGFLTDVVAVSTNGWHCLAVKSDGTMVAWGANWSGQLGDGTTTSSNVPVVVSSISDVLTTSAGQNHSTAIKADGTLWAWGDNSDGNLGIGSYVDSHVPVQVSAVSGMVAAVGLRDSTLALKADGTLRAWGSNSFGQLGDGTNTSSNVPVTVSVVSGVKSIAGNEWGGLALQADGTVWAWGQGTSGQLGNGANSSSNAPVQVDDTDLGNSVKAIGSHGGESNVVVLADGTVWAWGINEAGELGNGTGGDYTNAFDSNVPTQMVGMSNAVAASEGGGFSFIIKADGTLWSVGYNGVGDLGICTNTDHNTPVQVIFGGCPSPTPSFNTTNNYVALSRIAVNATATATIHFVLNDTLSSQLSLTFDPAFTGLNVSGASAATPSVPGCMSNFVATGPNTFTADKASCTGEVTISGVTVVNPPVAGGYLVSWINDAPGYAMVAIVDSDQVNVNAQVDPSITFDLNSGITNAPVSAPYSVALGNLTIGAVNHSDNAGVNSIWANLDTNATGGAVVTVLSQNAALKSLSVGTDTIPNSAASMAAGTANYGLCVNSVTAPSAANGTFQASAPYNAGTCDPAGSANAVKALSTVTPAGILDSNSAPVTTGTAEILVNAAISTATVAHSDYADVLTFVATGTF